MKKLLIFLNLSLLLLATSCENSIDFDSMNSETSKSKSDSAVMRIAASSGANSTDSPFTSFKPSVDYEMLFADRFINNNIDTANNWWNYRTDSIFYPYTSFTGYSSASNVSIASSLLNIKFNKVNDKYYGGGVMSDKEFGYGFYELRVKVYTNQLGFHQSFWSKSPQVEVDGFELESGTTSGHNVFKNCKHRWLSSHKKYITNSTEESNFVTVGNYVSSGGWQPTDGVWKTLSYEWLPDRINFYVDGVKKNTFYNKDTYNNDLNVYAPSNVYITGLPLRFQLSDVMPTTTEANASMQVENFAYSAKKLPGVNLLGNSDFELQYAAYQNTSTAPNLASWSDYAVQYNNTMYNNGVITNTNVLSNSGISSSYALKLENNAVARQYLYYIPDGKYTLSAWIKCSNPNYDLGDRIQMLVRGGDYQYLTAKYNNATDGTQSKKTIINAHSSWVNIKLEDVEVVDNTARIIFYTQFYGGRTGYMLVDNVTFTAQ